MLYSIRLQADDIKKHFARITFIKSRRASTHISVNYKASILSVAQTRPDTLNFSFKKKTTRNFECCYDTC